MLKGFLTKLAGLFKKKPVVVPPVGPTEEELAWQAIKAQYSVEYMETAGWYYVRYLHLNQWFYLRLWESGDYSYHRERGSAIKLSNLDYFDNVIKRHQEWVKGGHIYLNYD